MNKTITAVAAAAALALVAVGAPSDAHAQRGGAFAAGVLGGMAAGAIIGSAVAPRYYEPGYAPAPVYAAPPGDCVTQQWVWSPRRGEYVWRNVRVPC
jgi:hypothetical protein